MDTILVSIGTDGDILPYVGLGSVLRARGHTVTLVASEDYASLANRFDLAFDPLVSAEENAALFGHPDFWHARKTVRLSARWGGRFIGRQYQLLAKKITPESVVIANPAVLAAGLVHERLGVPWANLVLQPWMIPSSIAPPLMQGFTFLTAAPRMVWRIFWRGLDLLVDLLMGRELNRVRAELGLGPKRRIFKTWLSSQLAIGMFPEWYGAPQADWPAQLRLVGFPRFDGARGDPLPPNLQQFLSAGSPPIAFTFGSGMVHSTAVYRKAYDACTLLGKRGIFLTRHVDRLPRNLPASISSCRYAPFRALFPSCAAVVHHGGIGTVAEAMAAGTPQLIHPICFDQLDNGARVKRLGVGDFLRSAKCDASQMASGVARLLVGETPQRCRTLTTWFETNTAFELAADLVEKLHATGKLGGDLEC